MAEPNSNLSLIPGLEVVGRGVYLRPYQPYELTQVLFKRDQYKVSRSKETGQSYSVPEGYEVDDSPPFPNNQALNQVTIEESWDRFEKQINLDANVAVSNVPFSISASSGWNNQFRVEQDAYYALRTSFVPLWSVYVSSQSQCADDIHHADIPAPFSHSHRAAYEAFFRRFGSHYVKRAWVGGKSMLVFTVLKSSQLSRWDIQAGIKASFSGVSGGVSGEQNESKERLRKSSQCTVLGKGGNEAQLAAMSSLDEAAYNQWLKTIRDNPQVIELEVAGIWTLLRDPQKAQALMDAYREAVSFDPLSGVFDVDGAVYFIRGDKYVRYDRAARKADTPEQVSELIPGLSELGFERADAAFRGAYLVSAKGEKLDRKLFLFRKNRFIRLDLDKWRVDEGYPKLISEGWPGVTFEQIDAVLATDPETVYFFYGNQYIRFNPLKNRADAGYPLLISKRWVGVTFERIDAALYWGNGTAYFFKEDQHIRYDLANYRADSGYPKYIAGNYVQDWKFID
jgi:hypothetical protein